MDLRATNLNLLPILRALLTEASITRAAASVGLSQPATSHALGRLRDLLGDPLLVQVGRTMHLTPRAEALRPRVESACAGIELLLLDLDFVPARLQRDFTIATPDYMALLLGPALITALADAAPGVAVRFTDVGPDFRTHLASGAIDVAIVAHVENAARGFCLARGYIDRLVGVVARGHPLAALEQVRATDLADHPRLGIDPSLHGRMGVEGPAMSMTDGNGPLKLSASHLLALPLIIAQTSGFAVLPCALAEQAAQMVPLALFELPDPQAPLDICMMWSPIHDADAAQSWFRSILDGAMLNRFVRSV